MASMRKKSGHYYARFYDKHRSPKRKELALQTTRKDVARRRLTEWERMYEKGEFDPWADGTGPEKLTVEAALERFMEAKAHLRPRTVQTYRDILEQWLEGHVPSQLFVRDLNADHVRPYVWGSNEIANATRRHRYRHVKVFLRWAKEQGHLQEVPLGDVRRPKKEKKQAAFFSPDDLEKLLRVIDAHDETTEDVAGNAPDDRWLKHLIHVGVGTGLRRGELLRLRWQDVDLAQRLVTVRSREGEKTKSGHERRVPLRGEALKLLRRLNEERQPAPNDRVFIDGEGKPVKAGRLTHRFKFFVRKAELPNRERLRFHSLRHTCGSWLHMKGVPMKAIQTILGHATMNITSEIYAHVHDEMLGEAMEKTFG